MTAITTIAFVIQTLFLIYMCFRWSLDGLLNTSIKLTLFILSLFNILYILAKNNILQVVGI